MPKLRTMMTMPIADIAAVGEAMVLMICAVALVRFVPLRRWRGRLGDLASPARPSTPISDAQLQQAQRVARTVRKAERNLPFTVLCLPQALAARWMLTRRGVPTDLFIGGRKGAAGGHEFHAWLTAGEFRVTGQGDDRDFATFTRPRSPEHR